jgi:hypothetical protein
VCGVLLSTVAGMSLGTVGGEMPWLGNCLLRRGSNSNCFYFMVPGHLQSASQHGAVFTGVMPVSAIIFSYLSLHEPFQWPHLWGGLCVLAGLGFIIWESDKTHKESSNKGNEKNIYTTRYLEDYVS